MAGFRIEGNVSGNVAEVDAANQILVTPTLDPQASGFIATCAMNDSGAVSGTPFFRETDIDPDYRARMGVDTLLFNDQFPRATLNRTLWSEQTTTMTVTVGSGLLTLNAGSSVATTVNARVRSYQHFPIMGTTPLWVQSQVQFPQTPVTNNVCEWGVGIATGTAAPTDGVFWRYNASGEFRGVVNFNGTETQTATLDAGALVGTNTMHSFVIGITESLIEFWLDDVLVARLAIPTGQAAATSACSLPMLFRCYNSGTTAAAQQMRVGQVNMSLGGILINKSWSEQKTGMGGHASQGQTGQTIGSTANYANSANPTAAVPTNTTAALGTGLGGQFWETGTLALTTDGIIFSYQNPAGTATAPGRNLYISRVRVRSTIQTVLAGGPAIVQWSLAYGHTAVSLATVDGALTKAPRRIGIGMQTLTAAQAVNTPVAGDVDMTFQPPVCVYPGEFIATVMKKIGTVLTGGVIAHLVSFDGYWE